MNILFALRHAKGRTAWERMQIRWLYLRWHFADVWAVLIGKATVQRHDD